MNILKYIMLMLLLGVSSIIGKLYAKKYSERVNDLIEIKNALNMFKNKIKFTFEPIPEVFKEIGSSIKPNIGKIFIYSSELMQTETATDAWNKSIEDANKYTNLSKEDIEKAKELSKMLGNTDIDGQVANINLVSELIDMQIKKAEVEMNKNSKLYKNLGVTIGLVLVIILA